MIRILILFQIVLLTLKITGYTLIAGWPWMSIFAPVWLPIVLMVAAFFFVLGIGFYRLKNIPKN